MTTTTSPAKKTLTPGEQRRLAAAIRKLEEASATFDALRAAVQGRPHSPWDRDYSDTTSILAGCADTADRAVRELRFL